MLKVVIVDDEAAGRRALREYCAGEPDLEVVGEYDEGCVALEAIRTQPPDVVFLDIRMESVDGITLARSLDPQTLPLIVFVTAYDDYAATAFELSAVDYLLKPFSHERFRVAIERVRWRIDAETATQRKESLDAAIARVESAEREFADEHPRVLVGLAGSLQMLDIELVEAATASRNYVKLTVGRQIYKLRKTLQQVEKMLQSVPILRVSRSCLVNMNHLREVSRTPRGDFILVLSGGATLTSSEGFRDAVRQQLERFRGAPE